MEQRVSPGAKPFDQAASRLPEELWELLSAVPEEIRGETREIRMRAGGPLTLTAAGGTMFFTPGGRVTALYQEPCLRLDGAALARVVRCLCDYSVHSYTEDIARGFVTLPGGHRAGLCGTAVTQNGAVSAVRNISSVNLRIAREIPGAAAALRECVSQGKGLPGILIAGPPGSGKTTMLRDLSRGLSSGGWGDFYRVALVDERGELAGAREGVPCCDVGPNTDVLTGYPKGEGILLALRSLAPDVIICDELGGEADAMALASGIHAGVNFAASVHAGSLEELRARPMIQRLLELGAFDWIVVLESARHPCKIAKIIKSEACEI
ncbi:MAG: stage III sporulation protein AA [Oscillospiraceae bacterium]|nr:stage III sporulation protein AA [Oscillospiraceae bacterium]